MGYEYRKDRDGNGRWKGIKSRTAVLRSWEAGTLNPQRCTSEGSGQVYWIRKSLMLPLRNNRWGGKAISPEGWGKIGVILEGGWKWNGAHSLGRCEKGWDRQALGEDGMRTQDIWKGRNVSHTWSWQLREREWAPDLRESPKTQVADILSAETLMCPTPTF